MNDQKKTKAQLISELEEMRQRVSELEQTGTGQVQAEEALQESEEKLQATLISQSADGILIMDGDFHIVEWSVAQTDIFGYTREEMLGKPLWEFQYITVPDEQRSSAQFDLLKEDLLKSRAQKDFLWMGEAHDFEVQAKDGSRKIVQINSFPITTSGGNFYGTITHDITKRVRAEDALRKSEEKFAKAFHSNPAIAGLSDLETGEYVEVNQAFYDKLGFTPEEVIGKKSTEVVQMDLKFRDRVISKMKRQGYIKNEDVIIYHKNGTLMNMLFFAEIIEIAGKKYNFTSAIDITELKRSEAALRESEERYRNFYERVEDVIYETDYHGQITGISPSVEKHSGYRPDELIGQNVMNFYADLDEYAALNLAMEAEGSVNDFEIHLKKKSGASVIISVTAHIVFDEDGQPVKTEGVLRDITERVRAEQALKESEALLQQIINTSPNNIYVKDREGRYVLANQRMADMHKTTPEALVGLTDLFLAKKWLTSDTEIEEFRAAELEVIDKKQTRFISKEKFTYQDGTKRWFQTTKSPIKWKK